MAKTEKELQELKEKIEELNKELKELSKEELEHVVGGTTTKYITGMGNYTGKKGYK